MEIDADFWPIIAAASGDEAKFAAEMQKLGKPGMLRFYLDFRTAARPLHFPPFQRDGLSDDAVDDLAQYVIQQGKAFYDDILAHPEKHAAIDANASSPYAGVVVDVFHDRFHEEIGPIVARMEGAMGTDVAASFWPIIAAAGGDKKKLAAELEKLDEGGMVGFYMDWLAAAEPLHVPPFQRDGLSDDAVDDIAQYIIQQGKAFYDDILAHPKKHRKIDENAGSPYGSVITGMFYDRFHEEIGLIVARIARMRSRGIRRRSGSGSASR